MGIFKEIKVINTGMIKPGDFIHLKYKEGNLSDKVYNGLVTKVNERYIKVHICIGNELDDIEVSVTAASLTYVANNVNWYEQENGTVFIGLKETPEF